MVLHWNSPWRAGNIIYYTRYRAKWVFNIDRAYIFISPSGSSNLSRQEHLNNFNYPPRSFFLQLFSLLPHELLRFEYVLSYSPPRFLQSVFTPKNFNHCFQSSRGESAIEEEEDFDLFNQGGFFFECAGHFLSMRCSRCAANRIGEILLEKNEQKCNTLKIPTSTKDTTKIFFFLSHVWPL